MKNNSFPSLLFPDCIPAPPNPRQNRAGLDYVNSPDHGAYLLMHILRQVVMPASVLAGGA
jgi:hypothetical protein